jgi:hypothetical protein
MLSIPICEVMKWLLLPLVLKMTTVIMMMMLSNYIFKDSTEASGQMKEQ